MMLKVRFRNLRGAAIQAEASAEWSEIGGDKTEFKLPTTKWSVYNAEPGEEIVEIVGGPHQYNIDLRSIHDDGGRTVNVVMYPGETRNLMFEVTKASDGVWIRNRRRFFHQHHGAYHDGMTDPLLTSRQGIAKSGLSGDGPDNDEPGFWLQMKPMLIVVQDI